MKTLCEKPRLRRLLDHFSAVTDPREQWRVAYPLPEVLLLVVCGTIASCDDYDDIVDWGEAHLAFLRRFLPYFHGIPCADWLRTLMNRVDPEVFSTCFMSWVRETWPERPSWSPSTARPRGAAMTGARASRRCIWSQPSRPTSALCSARRRSRTSLASRMRSRRSWSGSPPPARSRARS